MRSIREGWHERGDTLVEVLVALSVLGIVVVGTLSLMNKGSAQMYDSMERSEVRMLLNRQVDALTYARDQHIRSQMGVELTNTFDIAAQQLWADIQSQPSVSSKPSLDGCVNNPENAFFVSFEAETKRIMISSVITRAVSGTFPSPGDGIWVQQMNSAPGVEIPYRDFYIRACWMQGSSQVVQSISTIVRLYDRQ